MTKTEEMDYIEKDFFPNHIAIPSEGRFPDGTPIQKLIWGQPGTNFYRVVYILLGGILTVIGDCGEAIYIAGLTSLKEWARCDLDYFARKCLASAHGRGGKTWDFDAAANRLTQAINERANDEDETPLNLVAALDLNGYDLSALHSRFEYSAMVLDEPDLPCFKPGPGEKRPYLLDLSDLGCPGEKIDLMVHAHLVGLKMAVKQLQEKGQLSC